MNPAHALAIAAAAALVIFLVWTWRRRPEQGRPDLQGPLGLKPDGVFGYLARGVRQLRKWLYRWRDPYWARVDWELQCVGPDGTVKDTRKFRNLVVNTGLDGILQRGFNTAGVINVYDYIAIGTDATGETATDPALGIEVDRQQAVFATGGTGVCTLTYTFGTALGWEPAAIVEAGLFDAAAVGVMFSRKTFAAINKAAGDTLKIVITITVTPA